jgi:hypothetical protein
MLVPVDETRDNGQALGVDDLDFAGQHAGLDAFFNGQDFPAAGQYVAAAHGARAEDLAVPYQDHAAFLRLWKLARV